MILDEAHKAAAEAAGARLTVRVEAGVDGTGEYLLEMHPAPRRVDGSSLLLLGAAPLAVLIAGLGAVWFGLVVAVAMLIAGGIVAKQDREAQQPRIVARTPYAAVSDDMAQRD